MPENGIQGFLGKDTAGLPNWGWMLVIVGGIAAAYFVPKFLGGQSSSTSSTDQSAQAQGQGGPSGIGLAVDPTTGLPYAVEGLSPSGGLAGGGGGVDLSGITTALNSILANLNKTTPPPTPTPKPPPKPKKSPFETSEKAPGREPETGKPWGPGAEKFPAAFGGPAGGMAQPFPPRHSTVRGWPQQGTTLGDVARMHGVSEKRLQQLNPQIAEPHNLQPGQKVRVA